MALDTIAIDIDEILFPFVPPFIEYHNKLYKTNIKLKDFYVYEFWEVINCTKQKSIDLVNEFATKRLSEIKPLEDAVEGISKLKEKYNLVIVSSRPEEIRNTTKESINKYFPNKFSEIYLTSLYSAIYPNKPKVEVCKEQNIKLIVEDSIENANQCAEEGIKAILLNYPWNQEKQHKNVVRVKNWTEIIEEVYKSL